MMEKGLSDNRTRYPFKLEIFRTNGRYLGVTSDISEGGLFLNAFNLTEIDPHQVYPIVIHTNNPQWPVIHALAEFRWSNKNGVGLEISPNNKNAMKEIINLMKSTEEGKSIIQKGEVKKVY